MSLKSFGWFIKLLNDGHQVPQMGLHGSAGDIQRLSARVRAAKAFRGVNLEGVNSATIRGYDAFFQILLTHSTLEQYLCVTKQQFDEIEADHVLFGSEKTIKDFFTLDPKDRLFDFVHKHLTNKKLKVQLPKCRDGSCHNVGVISASVRHIFIHGHLSANANDITPTRVHRGCMLVSDFLLQYIDGDFTHRLDKYWCDNKP